MGAHVNLVIFRKFLTNCVKFWTTFNKRTFGKTVGQRRKTASILASDKLTRPGPLPTSRPFIKGQNNPKLCLSFCHSLVSHPKVSFGLFTVLNSVFFFVGYSFLQTFTVYQTLAISLLAIF